MQTNRQNAVYQFLHFKEFNPMYLYFITSLFDTDAEFLDACELGFDCNFKVALVEIEAQKDIATLTFRNRYFIKDFISKQVEDKYEFFKPMFTDAEIDCFLRQHNKKLGRVIMTMIAQEFINWADEFDLVYRLYPQE